LNCQLFCNIAWQKKCSMAIAGMDLEQMLIG
jgi:hypothetical protein